MFKNYIKLSWRTLLRNKTYSLLVLSGLATGMTCALALWLYVHEELSFDRYHANSERIYRLNLHFKWETNEYKLGMASAPFGPAMQREYPEIMQSLRVKTGEQSFRVGQKALNVNDVICADSTLFSFFDYDFIEGRPEHALQSRNNIVLTEKLALALFGKATDLTGKMVLVKDNVPFKVSAVIRNAPANHHLKFDAILPYSNEHISRVRLDKWDGFNTITYLLLQDKNAAKSLDKKLSSFYKKYVAEAIGDPDGNKVKFEIGLQPLTAIHLHSSHLMGEENGSSMSYIYTFSIVGIFILLIAIVNYVNLATARSASRAKEIGVRKAIGSQWSQLVAQFLSESLMMSFMALGVSLLLLVALLPFFNHIADKKLALDLNEPLTWVFLVGFCLVTGIVSGLYPAFVLSRYRPAAVLTGTIAKNSQGILFRQSLVVFQFFVSMIMITGTITVYRQLQYMRSTELGFNQNQVISIPLKTPSLQQNAHVLKRELERSPMILKTTLTNGAIGGPLNNKTTFSFYRKGVKQSVSTEYFDVDQHFTDVLQIRVAEGRNFSPELDHDSSNAILINQAMIKKLGWKSYQDGMVDLDDQKVAVTGVIDDFHLRSLHNQIEPLVLVLNNNESDHILVKIGTNNIPATLEYIKTAFDRINAGQPFDYSFLDQAFAKQYENDNRKSQLFFAFSITAIVIACLGLFGLAAFTADQRKKEIGVRKVLGASVASIVSLLSKDFLRLVLIAIALAVPVCLYLMQMWLSTFAYKTTLPWWIFAISSLVSVVVALATVSLQSIKAALGNPVTVLKSE